MTVTMIPKRLKPVQAMIIASALLALLSCSPATESALLEPSPEASESTNAAQADLELPEHLTPNNNTKSIQITTQAPALNTAPKPVHKPVKMAPVTKPATRPTQSSLPVKTNQPSTPFAVKRCMNMGNALEAPNEGDWGYSIRAQDFRNVARAGFDSVRIPISWSTHAKSRPPYTIDPVFMTRVKTLVAQAQANGLAVILDVHHYEKLMANPKRHHARFLSLWEQISTAFANTPDTVYFELLNEPKEKLNPQKMNPLFVEAMAIIRRSNPTRKVIIGGYPWNFIEGMDNVNWDAFSQDKNIVATFHFYDPHPFTHQGAEWERPVQPTGVHWGSVQERRDVYSGLNWAKDFQTRTGLPIFVGEFGVIDKANQTERNHWMRAHRKAMEEYGFSWCAWDYAGAFKSFDIPNERWFDGIIPALTGP